MMQKNGKAMTKVVDDAKRKTLQPIIEANVEKQSEIQTDELHSYKGLNQSASDEELLNFLDSLKQSEDICSMCPSQQDSRFPGNPQWETRPIAPYA
jgi:transposase-like protein